MKRKQTEIEAVLNETGAKSVRQKFEAQVKEYEKEDKRAFAIVLSCVVIFAFPVYLFLNAVFSYFKENPLTYFNIDSAFIIVIMAIISFFLIGAKIDDITPLSSYHLKDYPFQIQFFELTKNKNILKAEVDIMGDSVDLIMHVEDKKTGTVKQVAICGFGKELNTRYSTTTINLKTGKCYLSYP